MAEGYNFQINVKIGDHLLNVTGETAEQALSRVEELASFRAESPDQFGHILRLHQALAVLDGRAATEIVQKEKQWGARSQAGRTYRPTNPSPAGPMPPFAQGPSGSGAGASAAPSAQGPATGVSPTTHNLLQSELGAVPVSVQEAVPQDVLWCAQHNAQRTYFAGGTSQSGKPLSESYRCANRNCAKSARWKQRDGSWS